MKSIFTVLFFWACLFRLCAQVKVSQEIWMEDILERLLENQNEESDRSDLELSIKEWIKHPLQLNKANKQDLELFFFLNPSQIQNIIDHRANYGLFLSKYELQAVQGLEADDIYLLNQFCYVEEQQTALNSNFWDKFKQGNHEIIIQNRRAFATNAIPAANFAGSLDYVSLRYRFQYKTKWYMGFALEKDAGEKWGIWGDFQTFHLLYKGNKALKTLAIGDYHVNMGTGLCVGSSHFSGKSSLVFQTQILQSGIRPSRSLSEMGFLRGVGLSFQKHNKHLDIWLSASPMSATIFTDSLMATDHLSGILLSGLHRTPQEIAKRKNALQQSYGFHFTFIKLKWQLGFILQKREQVSNFQFGSTQNISDLLNLKRNTHSSNYGSYQLKNINIQYEIALQNWQEKAVIIKTIIPLHSKLDGLILYRNYDALYTNRGANAWSAQSNLGNEKGLYWAFIFKPQKGHTISFYADVFNSKAAAYQRFKSAKGSDFFLSYQRSFSKTFQIETRFRSILTERNNSSLIEDKLLKMESLGKHQWRVQLTYEWHESWRYQFRLDWVKAQNTQGVWTNGSMIFHDINYQPKDSKWRLRVRYCLYQVSDYAARLYMPESDLPLSYANRMFQNNGYYVYLLGSYRINKHLDFHFKYAFNHITEDELLPGNWVAFTPQNESIVKCQVRFRF